MLHKIHNLKINPNHFWDIVTGDKTFEVRRNDRNFKTGDILCLEEFDDKGYTGKFVHTKVIYILDDPAYVKKDYVIMGTKIRLDRACVL